MRQEIKLEGLGPGSSFLVKGVTPERRHHLKCTYPTSIVNPMRQIGQRTASRPGSLPQAENLRIAAVHQATGQALAAIATTGVVKGMYRFVTHEAMNRHADDALAKAIAANVRQRMATGTRFVAREPEGKAARPVHVTGKPGCIGLC